MNFRISILYRFILLLMLSLSTPVLTENKIFSIESLHQISTEQPGQTLFLFDLDDTIFDSISLVGSKAWRRYIAENVKQIDPNKNWHDIFSYHLLLVYPMKTVQEITSAYVKTLQNKGYAVCGLTARERNYWYDTPKTGIDALTIRQLLSVAVDFDNGALERLYPRLSCDPEYFKGVFFANRDLKGEYLLSLLNRSPCIPEKIIFIDDKKSQVESVDDALTSLEIPHECYLYTATDEKANAFDPLIANIELYYFYESDGRLIISEKEAAMIAKRCPKKDADTYLQESIILAMKSLKISE